MRAIAGSTSSRAETSPARTCAARRERRRSRSARSSLLDDRLATCSAGDVPRRRSCRCRTRSRSMSESRRRCRRSLAGYRVDPCRSPRRSRRPRPPGLDQQPADGIGHQTVCRRLPDGPASRRAGCRSPQHRDLPGSSRRSARGSGGPSRARRRSPARARSGSAARRGRRHGAGSSGCRGRPRARCSRSRAASARREVAPVGREPRERAVPGVGEGRSRRCGARRRPAWSSRASGCRRFRPRRAASAGG